MRVRKLVASGMVALALVTGAACSEEDEDQVEEEVNETEGEVREGAEDVGDEVEERTDDLQEDE